MKNNPYLGAIAERIEGKPMPKKPAPSAPKAPADRFNKSAMSNDPSKLEDVDRRSKVGRRLRDLTASLTAQVTTDGEPLDDVVAAWIKLAAAGMLRAEQMSAAIGRGEVVKDEDLVRIMNAANRTVKELRDLKDARKGAKPGLSPLDADLDAQRAAEPDEDDDAEDEIEPVKAIDLPAPVVEIEPRRRAPLA